MEHVQHGQVLLRLCMGEEGSREKLRWSHLDEASRQLVGEGAGMSYHCSLCLLCVCVCWTVQ